MKNLIYPVIWKTPFASKTNSFSFFLFKLKYSWFTMFQMYSKVIQLHIHICFKILCHYRLLQTPFKSFNLLDSVSWSFPRTSSKGTLANFQAYLMQQEWVDSHTFPQFPTEEHSTTDILLGLQKGEVVCLGLVILI